MNQLIITPSAPIQLSRVLIEDQFAVQAEDWTEFMELSGCERENINRHLDIFAMLSQAPRGQRGKTATRIARQLKTEAPNLRGFSTTAILNKYKLYTSGGQKQNAQGKKSGPIYAPYDWRSLCKNYTNGKREIPAEFVAHLVQMWSETTREKDAWAGVHRRLKKDWLSNKHIPGYGHADEWYLAQGLARPTGHFIRNSDLPCGWSQRNLWRVLQKALPRKSMRRAAQGQANRLATNWAAQLLRDRSQLLPMQLWTIDDVRLDLQALMFVDGKWQVVYIDALMALDVATGYVLGFVLKGAATRTADTESGYAAGTKMSIQAKDVRALLCLVFQKVGLPPYASKLLCENATAKLSKDDEVAFLDLLKNRFEIDYTGMGHGQLMQSGFAEDWGRPGLKGWIESYFRLYHTSTNHLPGTTGRRYDMSRGDHVARLKYVQQIIRRAEKKIDGPLTPDHPLTQQLQFPVLKVDEATAIVSDMVDQLNWRIDHQLQGFDRIHETKAPNGQWLALEDLTALPPEQRTNLVFHTRMEAPAERLKRLCSTIEKPFQAIPPSVLKALYLEKRLATVKGGRITINDQRFGSDAITFRAAELQTLDDYEGRKNAVIAYIPDDVSHAVLACAESGQHLANLKREGRVNILDDEAIGKRAGEVRAETEAELTHLRGYLDDSPLARMREGNESALENWSDPRGLAQSIDRAETKQAKQKADRRRINKISDCEAESLLTPPAATHVDAEADEFQSPF